MRKCLYIVWKVCSIIPYEVESGEAERESRVSASTARLQASKASAEDVAEWICLQKSANWSWTIKMLQYHVVADDVMDDVTCHLMVLDLLRFLLRWISSSLSLFQRRETIKVRNTAYTVQRQLGEGGFSFVFLVASPAGRQFALKRVRIALPEHEDRLKSEIDAHSAVDSSHVIKLIDYDYVKEGRRVTEGLLLLPFYPKGTVQDLIDTHVALSKFIPLPIVLKISMDICLGLMSFHDHVPALAFRDLKPANILLSTDQNDAVLMDLGSVTDARVSICTLKEAMALQELCAETVTAPFRAPELIDPPSTIQVDERTDVWSLGCTIYAMAFGQSPFDGSATAAVNGQVDFPSKGDPYGDGLRSIILMALNTNIHSRPHVKEIYKQCDSLYHSSTLSAV